jgi:hypothetical protein
VAVVFKAKHPRNIPAAYYKPIGQLLVRWGFTELYLQSIVWHIWRIKDPKAARLLTWDLQAASKVELFKYLSPKWVTDPKDQAELKAIAEEADSLRVKRNRLAHGLWGTSLATGSACAYLISTRRPAFSLSPKSFPQQT